MSAPLEVKTPEIMFDGDVEEHARKIALAVEMLMAGKSNNVFSVTLEPNETETRLERSRITAETVVLLSPQSATAAAATGLWVETTFGEIIVHHDSQPDDDRVFGAVHIG